MNKSESFIVCVDDDRDFLNSLKISLPMKFRDDRNYSLLFMDNPVETLDLIKDLVDHNEEIALLMTDQMMPKMKGVDFLKEARQLTPNAMRVLLTGHAGMDSAITAINENLLDKYLTKPITDFDDLVFSLKRLLNEFHLKTTVDAQQKIILDLYKFSNTLNNLHKMKDILEHTVSFTRQALNCERISILLLEDGELVYKAGIGIPDDIASRIRMPLGKNIAGRVLKNREPLLVKDINDIPWIEKKINPDFISFISSPVVCAELCNFDVPLGVVNVTNKAGNDAFTEKDLRTLSHIANTVSIAINNKINIQRLEQSYLDTVQALIMALEARDKYTKGHSVRVMKYAVGIAKNLGLDQQITDIIRDAAILHDIGKIGIRDDVLLKAGCLAPEEFLEIRKHPEISGAIVKSISSLQEVGLIVRQHHERYDGQGYPDKIKGEDIHQGARIMAVADSFDAMTSSRPYRKARDITSVIKELKDQSGTQFDPECVEAMLKYLSENRNDEKEYANINAAGQLNE